MSEAEATIVPMSANFDRWPELLAHIMRSFAYMNGIIDPPSSALLLTADGLRQKAAGEACFLAIEDNRIVGCVFIAEHDSHLYVGKLAVEPDRQGRGIGYKLMQAAEDLALRRAKPALELQTRVELAANHAAFAAMGFRETRRSAHPGYARPTSITMRKVLAT